MKDYEPWLDKIMIEQRSLESRQNHMIEMLQYIIGFIDGAQAGQSRLQPPQSQQGRQRQAFTPLDAILEAVRQANCGIAQDKSE